jgi:hypothetical protein
LPLRILHFLSDRRWGTVCGGPRELRMRAVSQLVRTLEPVEYVRAGAG